MIRRVAVLLLLPGLLFAQTGQQDLISRSDELRKKPSRENLEKARELLQEAASSPDPDPKLTPRAFYRLGQVHLALGEPDKALSALEEARRRLEESGDKDLLPFALHNIAASHQALGDPATAIAMFEQVLPLRRAAGDRAGEGYTLYGIAAANWSLGEAAPALEAYRKALAIWQELKQPDNEGHAQNAMGLIFAMLGDYARARAAFEQALAIWRKSGNQSAPLLAWNNWCLASVGERRYTDALARCRTALEMAETAKNTVAISYASHNMANAYAGLGQAGKAIPLYEISLAHKREAKDRWGEAATLHAMGELRLEGKDAAGAADLLEQALALRRETGDRAGQAQTLGLLARVYDARGTPAEALASIRQAIALIEDQRTKLASQDLRATYLASVRDFYDLQIDLLMRTGEVELALEASSRARGRALVDRLSDTLAGVRSGVDLKLIERQRAIGRRLDAQAELLQRAAGSPGEKATIERRIDGLLNTYRDLAEQIRRASPKYAQLAQPEGVSAADFEGLLETGTVLLQYFAGKQRSYLWVVTPTGIAGHTLPGRDAIARGARTLVEAAAAKGETAAAASRLGAMLLGPAAAALSASGVRRVVIGADGEMESVPFALLPLGGRTLGEFADLAYLPSATGLRLYRTGAPGRPEPRNGIALFGDPVYSNEDPRFATRAATGLDLPRLRFSRMEAESIAKLVPAAGRLVALDFEASRQTIERTRLESYRMVHFATHSVSAARPELSGIALSQVDREGKAVDGWLRLHQIYNLNLRARLVTLSSCRSAAGEVLRGEGLTSIARGFLYAGAAAVVGTLWDIDDRASAELMKHFYEAMFAKRLKPAAALRAAQHAIRSRKGWEHPYYWAGFVLHGEWR